MSVPIYTFAITLTVCGLVDLCICRFWKGKEMRPALDLDGNSKVYVDHLHLNLPLLAVEAVE